ncbi:disease resistance protein RPM1 [Aegilops tauschii subsp. strangulata]|uniref:Disease resistance protein RPM1 n=2 Tax=Aegilops tauschii TaxID=37682 RepID=A0A452XKJ8_AEGTS|nr:disease resistance protein RPM1 [Aegilops tauschii subsp. strangulata]XP_045089780.1 disease resistance protein RPM1 [Aegilops tauschii subsp. strangulata]
MAEVVILSAVIKIGVALGNEALKQASSQFQKSIAQLTELQGRMGRIRSELRLMHGFLCRVDVRNLKNQNYGIWVQELRRLGHGIEDIVDEYLHLVGHKHDTGWGAYLKKGFKRPNVLLSLNRIALFVKEAEINLVHLFQAKDRWVPMVGGWDPGDSSYIVERSQHLASISRSLDAEDLVGVDTNREKLEGYLGSDDLVRSVIVLHGMGGLGKTALAANVYKKEREKFECHTWVSISQTYSIKDVLKCLITELYKNRNDTPGNINNMDINGLQDELRTFLQDKKYFIILDDVWAPEALNDLFGALAQNQKRSRVLVTTRIDSVAHHALQDQRITIEALSKDDSWKLFCKMGFSRDTNHKCPDEITQLAQEIVSKCKGIPLAIVAVGRLLFMREKTKVEFKRIHDQLDWELVNNPSMEHVRNILYLSFSYLPTHLKSCFLYCSLFPEDHLFHRKKLARLWIAEGFIEQRGASTLEEVAEGYMQELVHRNMLQLVERNSFGRIKKFIMHDIIRELAVDLCQSDCFGVTYEEDKCGGSLENGGRRLVVHTLTKDVEKSISSLHQLRSMTALDDTMPSFTLLPLLCEKSRYMTVLELSGLPIVKIPYAIGDLFNLRHLGLRNSKVKMLPNSVEKLLNLLTLDLCTSEIRELPSGIVKLKKLRHLFSQKWNDQSDRALEACSGVLISKGLGNLTNLQTLQALQAEDDSVRQLGELRQMRSLRLLNVKRIYCERLCESLIQMQFLSYLEVTASDENEVLRLNALPPNLQKLRLRGKLDEQTIHESLVFKAAGGNLYALRLNWSGLIQDPLSSFSRLTNLTELFLINAYNGEQLVFRMGWFPNLKTLVLKDLPHLKRIEIDEGAMATLEKLHLDNLNSMTEVPLDIKFLETLQHLFFIEISPEFLTLLRSHRRIGGMRQFRYSLRA